MNTTSAQVNSLIQELLYWKKAQSTNIQQILIIVEVVWFAGVTTVVCLIGIPTNIINCIVFWRQGLRDRMTLCLFSLALMDVGRLTCQFILYSVSTIVRIYDYTLGVEIALKTSVALRGVLNGFRLTSCCVSIIIAVERCLCVLFPLRALTLIKTRTVAIIIAVCFLLFHGLYVFHPFITSVKEIKINGTIFRMITTTKFFLDNKEVLNTLVKTLCGTILPLATFVVVSVTTLLTVVKLRVVIAWREDKSSISDDGQKKQMALTRMLVIVSTIYVITLIPFVAYEIAVWFVVDCLTVNMFCYDVFVVTSAIVYTCPEVSSCFNFVIYFYHSSRFISEFRKLVSYRESSLAKPVRDK